MDNVIDKRIKKIIETIILENEKEFAEKFGEEGYKDALKHKSKISKIALSDSKLHDLIKEEVEDCLGYYLLTKTTRKRKTI